MIARALAWLRAKRHRLAHRLGLTRGTVVSWWGADDRLWVGLRCGHCDEISSVSRTDVELYLAEHAQLRRVARYLLWAHVWNRRLWRHALDDLDLP